VQALVDAAAAALGLGEPSVEVIAEGWDFDVALLDGDRGDVRVGDRALDLWWLGLEESAAASL
jgi:hypothetical protein